MAGRGFVPRVGYIKQTQKQKHPLFQCPFSAVFPKMQEAMLNDDVINRGTKRKAEESNSASQAPKRIKVA